jgi:uncharacterized protein
MINRRLEKVIVDIKKSEKNLFITGPRQAGKTTLLKELLPVKLDKKLYYLNFDDPDVRTDLHQNAVEKLSRLPGQGIIFDEVQKFPFIFDVIKILIDTQKEKSFLLTGSSRVLMLKNIQESLAGRIGMWTLFPFSFSELFGDNTDIFLDEILHHPETLENPPVRSLDETMERKRRLPVHKLWGGFPVIHNLESDEERFRWLDNYRKTHLEKDVRDLSPGVNIDQVARFLNILAQRTGNILSFSELAKDSGISVSSAHNYMKLLELSYSVSLAQPYFENVSKRLIKSPKLYLLDTGLGRLLTKEFLSPELTGAMYETWVFTELVKWRSARIIPPDIFFYRTLNGLEIDFLVEYGGKKLLPIEVKNRATVTPSDASSLKHFLREHKDQSDTGIIVYTGNEIRKIGDGIYAVPDWMLFT